MADLQVQIREVVTIAGSKYDAFNTVTIDGINEISKRLVTLTTSSREILSIDSTIGSGTFVEKETKYLRITNKDEKNNVILHFQNADSSSCVFRLDKGCSFIYNGVSGSDSGSANVNYGMGLQYTTQASGSGIATSSLSLGSLHNITAYCSSSTLPVTQSFTSDIELFVASN